MSGHSRLDQQSTVGRSSWHQPQQRCPGQARICATEYWQIDKCTSVQYFILYSSYVLYCKSRRHHADSNRPTPSAPVSAALSSLYERTSKQLRSAGPVRREKMQRRFSPHLSPSAGGFDPFLGRLNAGKVKMSCTYTRYSPSEICLLYCMSSAVSSVPDR